jgi:Domain of unknown function (DUF6249)
MDGNFIPVALFGMIAAIVIVPVWLRSKERKEMQATLRSAIDKGQPLPSEVIEALSREHIKPPATAARDLRVGVILLAVSIGIALFGYAFTFIGGFEESKVSFPIIGLSAIPGMIGLAFIVLSFFNKNKD